MCSGLSPGESCAMEEEAGRVQVPDEDDGVLSEEQYDDEDFEPAKEGEEDDEAKHGEAGVSPAPEQAETGAEQARASEPDAAVGQLNESGGEAVTVGKEHAEDAPEGGDQVEGGGGGHVEDGASPNDGPEDPAGSPNADEAGNRDDPPAHDAEEGVHAPEGAGDLEQEQAAGPTGEELTPAPADAPSFPQSKEKAAGAADPASEETEAEHQAAEAHARAVEASPSGGDGREQAETAVGDAAAPESGAGMPGLEVAGAPMGAESGEAGAVESGGSVAPDAEADGQDADARLGTAADPAVDTPEAGGDALATPAAEAGVEGTAPGHDGPGDGAGGLLSSDAPLASDRQGAEDGALGVDGGGAEGGDGHVEPSTPLRFGSGDDAPVALTTLLEMVPEGGTVGGTVDITAWVQTSPGASPRRRRGDGVEEPKGDSPSPRKTRPNSARPLAKWQRARMERLSLGMPARVASSNTSPLWSTGPVTELMADMPTPDRPVTAPGNLMGSWRASVQTSPRRLTSAQQAVMVERLTRVPAAPERPPQKMGFVKCKLINGKMQEELVPPPVLPEKEYTRRLVEAHVKQTTKHKESIDKLRDKYYVPLVKKVERKKDVIERVAACLKDGKSSKEAYV